MPDLKISFATDRDLKNIIKIYNYYVKYTNMTLDWDEISEENMKKKKDHLAQNQLPFLVAKKRDQVIGYAYADYFRPRKGWSHSLESSIYLDIEHCGQGYGSQLLLFLIEACREVGAQNLISVVTKNSNVIKPNASEKMHQKIGFQSIGILENVGYKNDQWHNIALFQYKL